jgi:hypothetical protein
MRLLLALVLAAASNGGLAAVGVMDWSLGLRVAGQEYFYRFTDHARRQRSIVSLRETNTLVQGAIEEAFRRLLADMDAKDVLRLANGTTVEGTKPIAASAL